MKIVIDEASNEMGEMDEQVSAHYLNYMARVINWCATGDYSDLPPDAIPFACKIDGIEPRDLFAVDETEPATEREAIEA